MDISETSKVRGLMQNFLTPSMKGLDIGCKSEKLFNTSIGIDLLKQSQYISNVSNLIWDFNDPIPNELIKQSPFDYIYTAHTLHNSKSLHTTFYKFISLLKSEGILALVFPNNFYYKKYCIEHSKPYNHNKPLSTIELILEEVMGLILKTHKEIDRIQLNELYKSECRIDYNNIYITQWKFYINE